MKKIIPVIMVIALLLCGCTKPKEKDFYSLSEIYRTRSYGFYVKDGDRFYPLKEIAQSEDNSFRWCVGEFRCPKVSEKTPLVAVFETGGDMPESYNISAYKPMGFTIGANIYIGNDEKTMYLDSSSMCSGSNAYSSFASENVDEMIEIEAINGINPISNIDTDINILTGLQKDKYYDFNIFIGTRSLQGSICADTFVLKNTGATDLGDPLKKTHDQYFIVTLPDNITAGYYEMNDSGFFEIG